MPLQHAVPDLCVYVLQRPQHLSADGCNAGLIQALRKSGAQDTGHAAACHQGTHKPPASNPGGPPLGNRGNQETRKSFADDVENKA